MKTKDILLLVVPIFIVIMAWIGFSIYHSATKSTIPETLNIQIQPIVPDFDTKTITNLQKRKQVSGNFTPSDTGTASAKLSPTTTVTPAVSKSPTATPTPTPTPPSSQSDNQASAGGRIIQ